MRADLTFKAQTHIHSKGNSHAAWLRHAFGGYDERLPSNGSAASNQEQPKPATHRKTLQVGCQLHFTILLSITFSPLQGRARRG
jgi:hypothetical protein